MILREKLKDIKKSLEEKLKLLKEIGLVVNAKNLKDKSIREIASIVKVYDKNNNGKQISKSAVHKIIVSKTQ